MPFPTTKAAMMRKAQDVTDALAAFETSISTPPTDLTIRDLFWRSICIAFPGNESAILVTDPSNRTRSAHLSLALESWKLDIQALADTIAHHLHLLLPGQPLSLWYVSRSENTPSRFKLHLGYNLSNIYFASSTPPVIDTVLSRWKSPLVRLAEYLNLSEETPPSHLFAFHSSLKGDTSSSGVMGKLTSILVPAHTLDNAWALYGFHNADSIATPKPNPKANLTVSQIRGATYQDIKVSSWKSIIEAGIEETKGQFCVPTTLDKMACELQSLLNTLSTEKETRLHLNLMTGISTVRFTQHPFAAASDVAASDDLRISITALADDLCRSLHTAVRTVHPKMRHGSLTIRTGNTQHTTKPHWTWSLVMDGCKIGVSATTIETLFDIAFGLHWANLEGAYETYLATSDQEPDTTQVNKNTTCVVIKAANDRHAMLCLLAPNNPHKLYSDTFRLYTMDNIDQATCTQVHTQTLKRKLALYDHDK